MIDLNTCQPGQLLRRHDGLKTVYVGVREGYGGQYRHIARVYYNGEVGVERSYADNGQFIAGVSAANIVEILPGYAREIVWPAVEWAPVWKSKISPDHVEADCGFWAVHQAAHPEGPLQ